MKSIFQITKGHCGEHMRMDWLQGDNLTPMYVVARQAAMFDAVEAGHKRTEIANYFGRDVSSVGVAIKRQVEIIERQCEPARAFGVFKSCRA